ncbi:MAG: PEP-CTERM sorting domain-containing protein [Pirellulales bacterium]|nr:PEP-CTERM sorting domain-containing protein [Pirellulales bacterium]
MCRVLLSVGVIVLLTPVALVGEAATITFDEPAAVGNLGHMVDQLNVGGVTFTPEGVPWLSVPLVTPRTTFDDRSPNPYPYDFISGNLLQVHSTELRLDFSQPVSSFGFGAALNATSDLGQMQIDLFDSGLGSLGTFTLTLDRTLVSQSGGVNSNSEGRFFVGDLAGASRARITNFGDGAGSASELNFVVDNVTFESIPEPSTLLLLSAGLVGAACRRFTVRARRRRPACQRSRPRRSGSGR